MSSVPVAKIVENPLRPHNLPALLVRLANIAEAAEGLLEAVDKKTAEQRLGDILKDDRLSEWRDSMLKQGYILRRRY
jgi:hypothetical protein